MRYVPISCIKEGMIVAKSLYNVNNKLLIKSGYPIKRVYLDRIRQLGYPGIYIEDDLSKDIEIKDTVSNELRRRTVYAVKDVFASTQSTKKESSKQMTKKVDTTKKLVEDIVYDILNNRDAMVNMVDIKVFDEYTFYHSVNVAILSITIGTALNLPQKELYALGLAAVLHDIGKVYIDKDILLKKGKLTDEEFEIIKTHSELGYKHLKNIYEIPVKSYVGVLQHHERYNGTGYPFRKEKDEISLFGRIICIADVYDAITSNRPYRQAMLPSEGMEYIMANSGSMFDSKLVTIFINKIAAYPIGTSIRLSNNQEALVLDTNIGAPMRPVLRVYTDEHGEVLDVPFILDLSDLTNTKNITITEIIK